MNNVLKFTAPANGNLSATENTNPTADLGSSKVLEIRLLGKLEITFRGKRLVLPTKHAACLIAMLTLEGRMQREIVAARLWGERGEAQARASLRQTIYHVKKALASVGACALEVERGSISLRQGFFRTDVVKFLEDLRTSPVAAVSQCNGELFGNLGRVDPAFQEWLDAERRSFSAKITKGMETASEICRDRKDWKGLEKLASSRLEHDPFDEYALRDQMEALSRTGKRAGALVLFEEFRDRLRSSLQIEPEAATNELRGCIASWNAEEPENESCGAMSRTSVTPQGNNGIALVGSMQTFVIHNLAERAKTKPALNNLLDEIVRIGSDQLRQQASQSIAEFLSTQGLS